jgi:hypothetical protein
MNRIIQSKQQTPSTLSDKRLIYSFNNQTNRELKNPLSQETTLNKDLH